MLEFPNDPTSWATDDEFMLGSEFLVSPVKDKCWTRPICGNNQEAYLPPGRWVHLWSGDVMGEAARGSSVTVKAPVGNPAVFYREGSAAGAALVASLRRSGVM